MMQWDVAIIGGGLTGLITLALLSRHKKIKALLIEPGDIGVKSSGRSSGAVISGSRTIGAIDDFEKLFYIHRINNDLLREFISKEKLNININFAGSFRLSETPEQFQTLSIIYDRLQKYGTLIEDGVCSDKFHGGLFISGDYGVNPYDLSLSLYEKYKKNILTGHKIDSITNIGGKIRIQLKDKTLVLANKVVYTNNIYNDSPFLKPQKDNVFCITVENDYWHQQIYANFIFEDLIFRVVNEYIFITVPDIQNLKKEEDDVNFKNNKKLHRIVSLLGIQDPTYEYTWSQLSASTDNRLPVVGKIKDHEYVNIGYNPDGINCSFLGSSMVANEVLDLGTKINMPWYKLFHAARFTGV